MSRHYDITFAAARFCAVRELPQDDAVELVREMLYEAGQLEYHDDYNNDKAGVEDTRAKVAKIYAEVLDY